MHRHWKFEDALPCLRRFANAVISGGVDPVTSDTLARQAIKAVLAQKVPIANAPQLRLALYQIMLKACRNMDAALLDTSSTVFLPHSAMARGLYRLSQTEREALVLVAIEGFSHSAAAKILDLPIWVFLARLTRARENLRLDMTRQRQQAPAPRANGSYLRVVK